MDFYCYFCVKMSDVDSNSQQSVETETLPIRYLDFSLSFKLPKTKEVIKIFQNYKKNIAYIILYRNFAWRNKQNSEMKKILVAEDTESNFLLLSIILRRDYEILRAFNGAEAVEICRAEHPDLILMDIKMPVMDGLEATKVIRTFNEEIVIIALTANAYDSDREKAYLAGCNNYMAKPVMAAKLREMIHSYLG